MKVKLLIIILMMICLGSCQPDKQGRIVAKWYEPESNTKLIIPLDNGGTIIFANYIVYDYEDWCLKVESSDTKTTHIYYISSAVYDTLEIGERISTIELLDKDLNNKKIKIN